MKASPTVGPKGGDGPPRERSTQEHSSDSAQRKGTPSPTYTLFYAFGGRGPRTSGDARGRGTRIVEHRWAHVWSARHRPCLVQRRSPDLLEPHARLIWQLIASGPDRRHWWHSINRPGTAQQLRLWGRLVSYRQRRYQHGWLGTPQQLRLRGRLISHRQWQFQLRRLGTPQQLRFWDRLVSHQQRQFQRGRLGTARQLRLCVRLVFHWQQRYQFGWPGAAEQLRLGSRLVSFWYWKPL